MSGPIANLGLGRDGVYYPVAAGRAYHAGVGKREGVTSGNSCYIGIEAANTGLPNDPWPQVQPDTYARGAAALLMYIGAPAVWWVGHKEYALPPGRKYNPDFDMDAFRAKVAAPMA